MAKLDEETKRLIRLQPRAAELGWAIAEHPQKPSYRLVLYADTDRQIHGDPSTPFGLTLDEVERLLESMERAAS
jgi:hypothetical protein